MIFNHLFRLSSDSTTKVVDFKGDGLFKYVQNNPFFYATLKTDKKGDLPRKFTICSSIYFGQGYMEQTWFAIYRRDEDWPWFSIYDDSKLARKFTYDELAHKIDIFVNEFYEISNPTYKPISLNEWHPLCAAVDVESGKITVVRYVN